MEGKDIDHKEILGRKANFVETAVQPLVLLWFFA